jgi:hypothetical protein
MSDLERTLREARDRLPQPDAPATANARRAVVAATPASRRRRGLALGALVFAAAVAAAFAAGLALAPGGATRTAANGPGFLPATGWETFQTGLTREPMAPTATAATVPLGEDVLSETFPWQTITGLRAGQVLLHAIFYPGGETAGVDAHFPSRSLPLSLHDANSGAALEGQPPNVTALRLEARVNGWNLDLLVFSRGELTQAARTAAQEELERLVVPEAPPGALDTRPALRPVRGACTAAALRASVRLQGAAGTLRGDIQVRNVGAVACTLAGRPTVELRDANGVRLAAREQAARPLWRQLRARTPSGWPAVRIAPGEVAQVFVELRNWCVEPVKPVFFRTYLRGVGAPVPAPARITLRCDVPQQPVSLAVGPVEPASRR